MAEVKRLSEEEFFSMRDEWNALLEKSRARNFFLTWEWLSCWWRCFGKGKELMVLCLSEEDCIWAVAPLLLEKKSYLRHMTVSRIGWLGTDMVHSDHLDFIIKPGREHEASKIFLCYLMDTHFKWDLLELSDLKKDSVCLYSINSLRSENSYSIRIEGDEICPYLRLPENIETYQAALSKNTRYNIRRRSKNIFKYFQNEGVTLSASCSEGNNERMQQLLKRLFALHKKRWSTQSKQTTFSRTEVQNFHEQLFAELTRRDIIKFYSLNINDKTIGIIYGFVHGDKYFFYQSGFDPEFSKFSPGLVTMNFSIEDSIRNGLVEYDFLRGEEAYKGKFTKTFRRNFNIQIWRNKLKGAYIESLQSGYNAARRLNQQLCRRIQNE